ncbi:MAG: RNA polymerase sigma factor [Thermoanaerobaculales bacterium]
MTPTRSDLSHGDDALVMRAQNGDREAFGELVTRHQRRVWLVCRQYVGPDEADGAAQDSFIKAFTRIGDFDRRAAFTTWLTRIAINTCLDVLRRRRREGFRIEPSEDEDSSELMAQVRDDQAGPELRARLHQAVVRLRACEGNLAPRQREIFRLRFYAEMELDEIAATLDVHIGTVKTQLHRAVHRLRKELGEYR